MASWKTTGLAVGAIAAVVIALALFQPWKLWTNSTANEHVAMPSGMMVSGATAPMPPAPHGSFTIPGEHPTTGKVSFVRDSAGAVHLQITDLSTSEGPDVHVVLSEQAMSVDYKQARDLGKLRANHGDLVYDVPSDVDLSKVKLVAVWCKRFDALFGAAPLQQ